MMGLSGIGVLALLTAGNEYGSVVAKNRKIVKAVLNKYFTDKRAKKYYDMLLDITETCARYFSVGSKMDAYLDENHEITNDERFAFYFLHFRKNKDINEKYFEIAKSLTLVDFDNESIIVNFDKDFEKEYRMHRMYVKLLEDGMKMLEEKYGIRE